VAPDDVAEHDLHVLGLIDRVQDGVDGPRADLLARLDQLDELVDDCARLGDVDVVALDGQAVAPQQDRAVEPIPQRVQDPVADRGELGRDVIRDIEGLFPPPQCRD